MTAAVLLVIAGIGVVLLWVGWQLANERPVLPMLSMGSKGVPSGHCCWCVKPADDCTCPSEVTR